MEETTKPERASSSIDPAKTEGTSPSRIFRHLRENLAASIYPFAEAGFLKGVNPLESTSADAEPIRELANYEQLVARAVDVFSDEIKPSKWLSLPNPELNGETPLQVAQRHSYNGQVLEPIFTRIEHGIYF